MGRIGEGATEGRAGALHERLAQGRGRASHAELRLRRHHRPRIRRAPDRPFTISRRTLADVDGYVASARIAGVAPRLAGTGVPPREPTEPQANRPDDAVAVMIEDDGWR